MAEVTSKTGLFAPIKIKPGSEYVFRLQDGEQLSGPDLASAIKETGLANLPPELVSYLYDFLNGKIGNQRGRKPMRKSERSALVNLTKLIYRGCKMVLDGEAEEPADMGDFIAEHEAQVDESLSNSEKAARYTSIWFHGHAGHHRNIMNRISSHK